MRVEVVVDDGTRRVLMVGGSGPKTWGLPSAIVAGDEAPGSAVRRAVAGLSGRPDGRLLLMHCHHSGDGAHPTVTLVFDGGTVGADAQAETCPRTPYAASALLDPDWAAHPAVASRIGAAIQARGADGGLPVVWHGVPAPQGPSPCPLTDELWSEHLAWQLSETALRIDRSLSWPVTIEAASDVHLVLTEDEDTVRPVTVGLFWPGGHAKLTPDVHRQDGRVRRTVAHLSGSRPGPGVRAYVDSHVYAGDPLTAHGLAFEEVPLQGESGTFPAWRISPDSTSTTWVIAVHGRGATRREALRVLPTLTSSGATTLVVGYRNDPDCPASPNGFTHLGDTEWRDVALAVRYARASGATSVVLYGWSMGAMLALTALRRMRSEETDLVRGIVADCPVLDWDATFTAQSAQYGLSEDFARRVQRHIESRTALSLAELSQTDLAGTLSVPMLLFVDTADRTVPARPALDLARSNPDLITLITSDAGHGRGWNQDPGRYEAAVRSFLASMV
ncbi:alpha/beta fold hydrolase [Streptomyces sp. NPDC002643]